MDQKHEKEYIDISFRVSLILKGINAGLEVFFGIITIFITQAFVIHVASFLTQDELSENPKDTIANYFMNTAHHFSIASRNFLIFYLLSHGIIKLFLVISLWNRKLWAYSASLVIFSLFIAYQLYRYIYSHSIWLIALSVFDIFVLWLIWKEYSYIKKYPQAMKLS